MFIPTILIATVMIAGVFAFTPVDTASTIHSVALQGTSTIRIVEAIEDDTGLSGDITFSRINGEGVWKIESLKVCDFEADSNGSSWVFYTIETDTVGDRFVPNQETGTGDNNPTNFAGSGEYTNARNFGGEGVIFSQNGQPAHALISGSAGGPGSIDNEEGQCTDLLVAQKFEGGTGQDFLLYGDEDNDVVMHFFRADQNTNDDGAGDGAFIIAYISGVGENQMTIIDELRD